MTKNKSKKTSVETKNTKMDSKIVIAIIGLIGTLITAVFASPVLTAWFQNMSSPPNTQSATTPSAISNIAPLGTVEVSSISSQADFCQKGASVIDGIVGGYPDKNCNEWVASSQDTKAWIKIGFKQPYLVYQVILHDRVSDVENILGGTLEFSDGSSQEVEYLPNDGSGKIVSLPIPKTIDWIKFTINQVGTQGTNTGLAEIEIMGSPINP